MVPKPIAAIIAEQEQSESSRHEKAQKLFEEIQRSKRVLKTFKEEMKDLCALEPGYEESFEKQNQSKATLKEIQNIVENRNSKKVEEIKNLKNEIKQNEGILNEMLLYEFIDLSKSGKALDPRQMSLFDHEEKAEFIPVLNFKFDKILKENEEQNVETSNDDLEDETL